jgi:arylsulfatase A-like enzyme
MSAPTRRGVLASSLGAIAAPAQPKLPNILFILADDLGFGDLSCYGQKQFTTPNIDALADAGTRFTEAYAGNPVCAPSRCTLMTGLHNGHARVRGNYTPAGERAGLRAEDRCVGELLQRAGYRTGLIGKWGLGEPGTPGIPNKKGFDYFYGFLNQNHAHHHYPDYLWRNEEKVVLDHKHYAQDLFTAEALAFLRPKQPAPWFLELSYTLPHEDFDVPAADLKPFAGRFGSEQDAILAAMISRLDRDVGRVISHLQATRQLDNTLVLFASDNGAPKPHAPFQGNGALRGFKGEVYEGGLRVPFIARGQGIPRGAISRVPFGFVDFLPTIAEIAGAPIPSGLDGVSALGAWRGKNSLPRSTPFYWELANSKAGGLQALRDGDWKIVRNGTQSAPELYNLSSDPSERNNLAASESARVTALLAKLEAQHVDSPEYPLAGGFKKK